MSGWSIPRSRRLDPRALFPGFRFQLVDALITNFQLPESSL